MRALDPLVGSDRFDFIGDIGAMIPMRTIGYLLGIPEQNQATIRDNSNESITLKDGEFGGVREDLFENSYEMFADYIDWRADHPSDDLMTQLLNAELEEDGTLRRLTRTEVLMYTSMVAGAGNETTTRLIGFAGQLLAEHPDQRRQLADDFSLIPRAIEEVLRYEAPSPVQARYVARDTECRGQTIPEGSVMLLTQRVGEPRRATLPGCRPLRHPPRRCASQLRPGPALLPGIGARTHAGAGGARRGAQAMAGLGSRL